MASTMHAGLSPERGGLGSHADPRVRAQERRVGNFAARTPGGARIRTPLAGWLLPLALLLPPHASRAEQPLLAPSGLHGGRYVGLAEPPTESLRVAGSVGYGFTEDVLDAADRHHRLAGELYGAWLRWPALQISLGSELRYDGHRTNAGSDAGLSASTRVTTRHALQPNPRVSLAAQPSLLFPGAADAKRGFSAATLELSGLGSYRVSPDAILGLSLGYRFDRTERAAQWEALSPSDRLAASLSRHDAYLLGAIAVFSLWSLKGAVELSWDIPAAGGADALHSPLRLRTALQKRLSERFVPGVELGVDASARPAFDDLVRIEPRFWARLGVSILLDPRAPARAPPAAAAEPEPTPKLVISVLDERGWPLPGARVALAQPAQAQLCDQFGRVALELPAAGAELSVEAEGYQPVRQRILPGATGVHTVKLSPRVPAGEIKGTVRDLAGKPLRARIEVLPLGQTAFSDAEGQFLIEVAPGDYTLRISAEGYDEQDRPAEVELRGVTILVIDLRKTSR